MNARPPILPACLALALAALTPFLAAPALAQPPAGPESRSAAEERRREAERRRQESRTHQAEAEHHARLRATEARRLQAARVAAAARVQEAEAAIAGTEERLAALGGERAAAEAALAAQSRALAPLLPLMLRLSRHPAGMLLAGPAQPAEALAASAVLGAIARDADAEAASLRAALARLSGLEAEIAAAGVALAAALAAAEAEAAALDGQIEAAEAARQEAANEARAWAERSREAAREAADMRALIAGIDRAQRAAEQRAGARTAAPETEPDQAEGEAEAVAEENAAAPGTPAAMAGPAGRGRPFAQARGQAVPPVAGRLIRGFGAPEEGGRARGLVLRAAHRARVVAPWDGRVVFAGPFRSYGQLLIIDHGGGYHFVLSGLGRIDVVVGQRLVAGEPVGVMPAPESGARAQGPALHVELRRNGQTQNPAPWLAFSRGQSSR